MPDRKSETAEVRCKECGLGGGWHVGGCTIGLALMKPYCAEEKPHVGK